MAARRLAAPELTAGLEAVKSMWLFAALGWQRGLLEADA